MRTAFHAFVHLIQQAWMKHTSQKCREVAPVQVVSPERHTDKISSIVIIADPYTHQGALMKTYSKAHMPEWFTQKVPALKTTQHIRRMLEVEYDGK